MTDQTLDCSDLDNFIGKPMQPARIKEALHNNDFRRWVQAMHYPNLLHYDHDFAAEGRFGRLVAPQSFAVATDDGHGAGPVCVGCIPGSHLIFGGDNAFDLTRLDRSPASKPLAPIGVPRSGHRRRNRGRRRVP